MFDNELLCYGLSKKGGQDLDKCVKGHGTTFPIFSDCLIELEVEFIGLRLVHEGYEDKEMLYKIFLRGFFSDAFR